MREAASERKIVETIAPHLARETPFIIPARNAGAVAKLRAGLWTFEKLGGVAAGRKHEMWSVSDIKAREPAIRTDGLIGAIVYPEFITDDARLTLANHRLSLGVWTERPDAAAAMAREAATLRQSLGDLAVSIDEIHLYSGKPPAGPPARAGGFIDRNA